MRKSLLNAASIFISILVLASCSRNETDLERFNYILGDWERIYFNYPLTESATLSCKKANNDSIICTSIITKLRDSASYKVNYNIKKDGGVYLFEIKEWGKVVNTRTFLLDKPRITTYQITRVDSTSFSGQKDTPQGMLGWLSVSNYEEDKLMILSDDAPQFSNPFHYQKVGQSRKTNEGTE